MCMFEKYKSAEITLFWIAENEDSKGSLIYAVTELVPENQLLSPPLGGGNSKYLYKTISNGKIKKHIYCRRFYSDVSTALKCFEEHNWTILVDGPDLSCCHEYKKDPEHGFAVVPSKYHIPINQLQNNISMVLPGRSMSFRVSAYMDGAAETEHSISDDEKSKIVSFIRKYCDVDLALYNEFIGANILCMQNPIIWNIKSCISEDKKSFRFLLQSRDNETVKAMTGMIKANHMFGATTSKLVSVESEVLVLPIPNYHNVRTFIKSAYIITL